MNNSCAASVAYEAAMAEVRLAQQDLERVERLVFELYRSA
jgi:hypothetical protein